jgi:nicotinamidase-related amidase
MKHFDALLVIDMQNDYYPGGRSELVGIETAHAHTLDLIAHARKAGSEVIFIRHIAPADAPFFAEGSEGAKLHADLPIEPNDTVITKHYPNSFRDTGLDAYLIGRGYQQLMVCGAMTHMCIDTTVRAGYDLGYDMTLIGDACATKDLLWEGETIPAVQVHRSFLSALNGKFCRVIRADS